MLNTTKEDIKQNVKDPKLKKKLLDDLSTKQKKDVKK